MDNQTIYSEVDVKTKVGLSYTEEEKNAKIEEFSSIATIIWKKIIEVNLKKDIPQTMLLSKLQSEYNEFFLSFPLVLRWMVEMHQFKIKAFKQYLKIFIESEIKSKKDFLILQGKYLVILYKELNPSLSDEKIEEYEEEINSLLMLEDKSFKEMEEAAIEEINKETKKITKEKKEELYNMILRKKSQLNN